MQEIAENNCVYRNEIHHSVGKQTQVLQDVAADPTLPRTKTVRCAQCNHGEAVFFQVINCYSIANQHVVIANYYVKKISRLKFFSYQLLSL